MNNQYKPLYEIPRAEQSPQLCEEYILRDITSLRYAMFVTKIAKEYAIDKDPMAILDMNVCDFTFVDVIRATNIMLNRDKQSIDMVCNFIRIVGRRKKGYETIAKHYMSTLRRRAQPRLINKRYYTIFGART